MNHPELILLGIDGAVDSYIVQETAKGNLPNFNRFLKAGTRLGRLYTAHPSITPTCWSSIMTGATQEIHGISSDILHHGGLLSDMVTAYHGDHLKAERFWEAAAKIGKTSLISLMPVSGPARSPLVRQCGGLNMVRTTFPDREEEFYDVPLQVWFFDRSQKPVSALKDVPLSPSPAAEIGSGKFYLEMKLDREPNSNYRSLRPFGWELYTENNGFFLRFQEEKIPLAPDSWSKVIYRILPAENGSLRIPFRFGCFAMEDGFLILSDVTGELSDICTPDIFRITRELPPPPLDKAWVFLPNPATVQIGLDSWKFQTDWQMQMIRCALQEKRSDILTCYLPNPDTLNHIFWQVLSSSVPAAPERRSLAERCYRDVYADTDRFLGFLLDEIADENTTILIVSDHGAMGYTEWVDVDQILEDAGYLFRQEEKKGAIDCSRSRAALRGYGHIFLNLKGRETSGIVPQEDYDKMCHEIIALLQDKLRAPDGSPYLAFAVCRDEAGFFGLGGENCGDIVYGLTSGYGARTIHGEQIPSACGKSGSMQSLGLLKGPEIRQGFTFMKPVRTIDLAPTLCGLLGYPPPEDQCGSDLSRKITGNNMYWSTVNTVCPAEKRK